MSNGSRLPARSNFRRGNRRGGSQTLNATNVPQVRGSVDQGQRIPNKGLFGEYETENLASMGEGFQKLSNQMFAQHKREQLQLERISLLENQAYASNKFKEILRKHVPNIDNQSGSKK